MVNIKIRSFKKAFITFITVVMIVAICLPLTAYAAQVGYDSTFINCAGDFPAAHVQFTGKYLVLSAAASKGGYGNATSVTVAVYKKDLSNQYSIVVATRTIPLDGVGYAIATGQLIPTNQEVEIRIKVNQVSLLPTANVSISATSFN